jgi:amino acid transporter
VESASIASGAGQPPAGSAPGEKGLKSGALGYLSNLVIGVASTAPGYSLAATLGFIAAVEGVGLASPAVLWVSFVPMLFIASAYYFMNRADPDCGTTFSWVTRAMGPTAGWLGGWAIIVADIIVMANLAQIAGLYTFLLFDWNSAADSTFWVTFIGVIWIIVMTAICYIGIELSARTQYFLLTAEVVTLALFAIVALVKVYAGSAPDASMHPDIGWLSPFAIDSTSALTSGVLLGVFIYWGWDSGVAVNEESENPSEGPGRAAIMSTIVLVLIYVIVSVAAQAFAGPKELIDNADDVLSVLGKDVFGSPLDKLLIIAVLTSASASTQTTILPTARTSLSMARARAMPATFGEVHPRYLTPSTSTLAMGALSVLWYVALTIVSENILFDSLAALGLMIAFYYGLTGFACAIYYRSQIFKAGRSPLPAGLALLAANVVMVVAVFAESNALGLAFGVLFLLSLVLALVNVADIKKWALAGVAPLLGAEILSYVFWKSCLDLSKPENSESGDSWLGLGPPLVIGIGFLILGIVLMLVWRFSPTGRDFFRRRPEVAAPEPAT